MNIGTIIQKTIEQIRQRSLGQPYIKHRDNQTKNIETVRQRQLYSQTEDCKKGNTGIDRKRTLRQSDKE